MAPAFSRYIGIAEWLIARLADYCPMVVGIDHGFSISLRYL